MDRRQERRDAILDAALSVLAENGYAGTSMAAIARAAGASKETLYSWFTNKQGLFEALVARQAAALNADLAVVLEQPPDTERDAAEVLTAFGRRLLELLLGTPALTINRAAIAEATRSPELGRILGAAGRDSTRPRVEAVLRAADAAGALRIPDPGAAFEQLVGLIVGDLQIRVLFGAAEVPEPSVLAARAERAVGTFVRAHQPA